MDNSSNFLGETDPNKMDNSSNFLGETEPTKMDNSSNFLGETDATEMDNSSNFLGETTPSDFDNSSNFLGETTPSDFDNSSNFLGETTPSNFDNSSNFLGETTPSDFDNSSNFLGETTPSNFDNSSNFLGETTPSEVNYISDIHAEGFTSNFNNVEATKFVGVNPDNTLFDSTNSTYSNFLNSFPGLSFVPGYDRFKPIGNYTGDTQRYNPDKKYYIDGNLTNQGISQLQEMVGSPSFLDKMYDKFNLKDDSYNTTFPLLRHPLVLSGIQKKGGNPENFGQFGLTFDDGLIRGGTLSSTTRAFIDTARIATWLLSPKGILWSGRQLSTQRTNKFGKVWTPANLLTAVGSQHLGLKPSRPGVAPFGDLSFQYQLDIPLGNTLYKDKLQRIYISDRNSPFSEQGGILDVDPLGGFDSFYGIGITNTTRYKNTFNQKGIREQKFNPFDSTTSIAPPQYSDIFGYGDPSKGYTGDTYEKSVPNTDTEKKEFALGGKKDDVHLSGFYLDGDKHSNGIRDEYENQKINPFKEDDVDKGYNPIQTAQNSNLESKEDVSVPTDEDDLKKFGVASEERVTDSGIYTTEQDISPLKDDIQNQKFNPFKKDDEDKSYVPSQTTSNLNSKDGVSLPTDDTEKLDFGLASKDPSQQTNTNQQIPSVLANKEASGNTDDLIKSYETVAYGNTPTRRVTGFNDFRENLNTDYGKKIYTKQNNDYSTQNINARVNFNDPGKVGVDRSKWSNLDKTQNENRYDIVNAANIGESYNDLVHFWVRPSGGSIIQFRGTVSGVTETFSPSWTDIKYNGRADTGKKYESFGRTVSFNFRVAATSRVEMKPIWQKLQRLATMTMPQYGGSNGYKGTLVRFRLGQLYFGKLAFIDSLSYTISDEASWEISPLGTTDSIGELPKVIDVSIGFTILDDITPRYGAQIYDGSVFRGTSGNTYGDSVYDITNDENNVDASQNSAVTNYKYSWESDETTTQVQSTVNE